MSSLVVKVRTVEEILPHNNADRLEIAVVGGWRCVVGKGTFSVGEKCVYFPPDCILPENVAEKFGITKYLSPLKQENGIRPKGLRVRAQRLRGEPSFGTVQKIENPAWEIDENLVDFYGVTKWEPPVKCVDGDADREVPAFHTYTSIENWQNFPTMFMEGEAIAVTEKLHGQNIRLGLIRSPDEDGNETFKFMAGSHSVRRKEFNLKGEKSEFWKPLTEDIRNVLLSLSENKHNVIIFAELIGTQDMKYGLTSKEIRIFDISIDRKYLDFYELSEILKKFKLSGVPTLYVGPYSREKIESLTDGETTACEVGDIKEPFKGREGVVFRSLKESYSLDLSKETRRILKSISADYHGRKNKDQTEYH